MIAFLISGVSLVIAALAWIFCCAAAKGEREADELYKAWLKESGYGRESDNPNAAL